MKFKIFLSLCIIVTLTKGEPLSNNSNTTLPPTTTTQAPTTTTTTTIDSSSDCKLSKSSEQERKLLQVLEKMRGEKYTWEDKDHEYFFSICSNAQNSEHPDEGFIQKNKATGKRFVLGRLNDVDLEGTNSLIRVYYKNGDRYANVCNRTERGAVIYLICDPNKVNPEFNMIEENNDRENECAYIFELLTPKVCNMASTTKSTSTQTQNTTTTAQKENKPGLGVVPIVLIVVFSLLSVYFIVGSLYMRYVKRASGWEQIPNFGFWSAIGDGSADMCNLLCRCGNRRTEIHTYENINDRLSDDENLLNM